MKSTKQKKFLDNLKHPNRALIERDIKLFLDILDAGIIIETHVNRDKGSNVHTITITVADLSAFEVIDSAFIKYLPVITYAHGECSLTEVVGPEIKNHVTTYSTMYLIEEY